MKNKFFETFLIISLITSFVATNAYAIQHKERGGAEPDTDYSPTNPAMW